MKFFSIRRFNYIDLTGCSVASITVAAGETGLAAIIFLCFMVLSVIAENIWGKV